MLVPFGVQYLGPDRIKEPKTAAAYRLFWDLNASLVN